MLITNQIETNLVFCGCKRKVRISDNLNWTALENPPEPVIVASDQQWCQPEEKRGGCLVAFEVLSFPKDDADLS